MYIFHWDYLQSIKALCVRLTVTCIFFSGLIMLFDSTVSNSVLLAVSRNHPTYISGHPTAWKVLVVYNDSRDTLHLDYRMRTERALPVRILSWRSINIKIMDES